MKVGDTVWYFPSGVAMKMVKDEDGNTLIVDPKDLRHGDTLTVAYDEIYDHGRPLIGEVSRVRDDGTIDVLIANTADKAGNKWVRRYISVGKPTPPTERVQMPDGAWRNVDFGYVTVAGG